MCPPYGLSGRDSSLFGDLTRIATDIETVCREHNRPLWRLFENVVAPPTPPNPRGSVETMSNHFGFAPVHVDASDFGWTSRKRLIWCDACVPDEWKGSGDTDTFSTKGWHTLDIPRRRRKVPPLGSILKSPFKPFWLSNNSTPLTTLKDDFPSLPAPSQANPPHGFDRSSEDARQRCEAAGKPCQFVGSSPRA